MGTFENTFGTRQPMTHAEANIKARESAKLMKEIVMKELGIAEKAEIIFESLPSKAERTALAIMIKNANTVEDLRKAQENASVFSGILDCSTSSSSASLTSSLHALVDDFEEFIGYATHPASSDGEKLSVNESDLSEKLLSNMAMFIADLSIFVNARKA